MKKILISIITILSLLILLSTFTYFSYATNYIKPTLNDVKNCIDADNINPKDSFTSSSIINNTTLKLTTSTNEECYLYCDIENNVFYTEETIDNNMDDETISNKLYNLLNTPFYGFMASSQKNNIPEDVYNLYLSEQTSEQDLIILTLAAAYDLNNSEIDFVNILDTHLDIDDIKSTINTNREYYSTKLEKTKTDSTLKLKYILTINPEQDFSKMEEDYSSDYKIYLKVGETYTIPDETSCNGYSSFGDVDCYDFDKSTITFTAIQEGEAYGELRFGKFIENEDGYLTPERIKTFYIKVSPNGSSQPINNTVNNNINNNTNNNLHTNQTNNKTNSVIITKLPDAGINSSSINIIKIVLSLAILAVIAFTIYNISQKKK